MLASLAFVQPAPPAPEVHAPPRPPAAHPFAQMLRQSQAAPAARPAPTPTAAPETPGASDDTTPADDKQNARPAQALRDRKTAERTPLMRRAAGTADAAAQTPAPEHPAERPGANLTSEGRAAEGGVLPGLAAEGPPMPLAAHAVDPWSDEPADAAETTEAGRAATSHRAGRWVGVAEDDPKRTAAGDHDATQRFILGAAADGRALDTSPMEHRSSQGTALPENHGASGAAAALPTAAAPAPGPLAAGAAAAPVQVGIPTAPGAPDFAAAFGLQVSVLAGHGVHKAELHLNPADMGPVSVQIVVDGTQARIDFGADVAATRQAIEAGIPELASALRDAGLTLHGGGVSPHAGGRDERDEGDGERGRAHSAEEAPASTSRPRALRDVPGGVDVYA